MTLHSEIVLSNGRFPIVGIKHGQKISEPGIYRIPMGWYHDDCCVGPSISSSGLRTLETETARAYFYSSPYNPNRPDDKETEQKKHFRLGRGAHTLFLEPETFHDEFVTRPAAFDSWRTKEAKNWRTDAIRDGKTVLDPPDMEAIIGIAQAIRAHPYARDGLFTGEIECAIIWKDPRTGIWLKSRPDAIPRSAPMLVDIKCLANANPRSTHNAIRDFAYDMQLALGGIGIETVLGMAIEDYAIFAVSASPPHDTFVQALSDDAIHWARLRLRRSINRFAECLESGDWPSYGDRDGEEFYPDGYAVARWKDEQKAGILPKEF